MEKYNNSLIYQYIEKAGCTSNKEYEMSESLKLGDLINNINPYYLFTNDNKYIGVIVKELLCNYMDSIKKKTLHDWLKGLAIFINEKVYNGKKSLVPCIDLEFDKENIRYIVSIKSGPNWGNASQIDKLITTFNTAKKTLRTSNSKLQIICVNGCCYGKDNNPDKGSYLKYCGQRFWEFIGGEENIYTDIIEPLGYKAKERNENYLEKYSGMINRLTNEFFVTFCDKNGMIDWEKLVKFNSGYNF